MNTSITYENVSRPFTVNVTVNPNALTASDINQYREAISITNGVTMTDFNKSVAEAYVTVANFEIPLETIEIARTTIRPVDQELFSDIIQALCDLEIGVFDAEDCKKVYDLFSQQYSHLCAYRVIKHNEEVPNYTWRSASADVDGMKEDILDLYREYCETVEKYNTTLSKSIAAYNNSNYCAFVQDSNPCCMDNEGIGICESIANDLADSAAIYGKLAIKLATNFNYLANIYKTLLMRN